MSMRKNGEEFSRRRFVGTSFAALGGVSMAAAAHAQEKKEEEKSRDGKKAKSEKGEAAEKAKKSKKRGDDKAGEAGGTGTGTGAPQTIPGTRPGVTPFRITPFTQDLPFPPVMQPTSIGTPPWVPGAVHHGIAPEFSRLKEWEKLPTKYYDLEARQGIHQFIPGVDTPVWAYNGVVPGPTFQARIGEPCVVRITNSLPVETSVHLHGGHTPAHADGHPEFYILQGQARDYFYPNCVPLLNGEPDYTESPSTCWYHDHAMDITAHNAYMGCAGFFICQDDLEGSLIDSNVLPKPPYDVPLVIADRTFNADGTMYYDFLDHNGAIGDVFIVNAVVQPKFVVERRKYRFRILCASNARVFNLRLSTGEPFLQIATDAWLLPYAMQRPDITMTPAKRAEVIIDFTNAPAEVFLENWMAQTDGRKPDGIAATPVPLVKFIVQGAPARNDATVTVDTPLRPHTPILPEEIEFTRAFNFGRSNGVWTVNNELYDGQRVDAVPRLGSAERWILRNSSGGWWHPIHIHLESHQIQRINGQVPDPWDRYKSDTAILQGNTEVELFMKFRTFEGPFVFHCHNLEHEDMRMMQTFDPRPQRVATPTPVVRWFP